jgi:CRP-like cAMP-binding protein
LKFLAGGFDFGERALITNEPRSATVMTATPTDLLVVDRVVFSRFVIKICTIISF